MFKIFQYKYSQSEDLQAYFSPLLHFSHISTKLTPPLAPRGRLFATIPTGVFLSWSTRQCASFYARNPAPLQHTRNQWLNSLQPNCLIQPTHITRLHQQTTLSLKSRLRGEHTLATHHLLYSQAQGSHIVWYQCSMGLWYPTRVQQPRRSSQYIHRWQPYSL